MTTQSQIKVESITFLLLAGIAGLMFAFYVGYKPNKLSLPVMQSFQSPTPAMTPNPQITSQLSPDGKKLLTMTVTTNEDLSKSYVFATSDADGNNQKIIYSTMNTQYPISIPFNTWSPDDRYVFITETTSQGSEAIVLKADGEQITDTESSINLTKDFTAKITNSLYDETTGWASETLLLVNTKTPDGKKGLSYWFEVPSKAIISLSTQF